MSETTVIQSTLQRCDACDNRLNGNGYHHPCDVQELEPSRAPRVINRESVVANNCENTKDFSQTVESGDPRSPERKRMFDENDLRDLVSSFEDSPFRRYLIDQMVRTEDDQTRETFSSTSQWEHWDQFYAFPRLFLRVNSSSNREGHREPFILQPSLFHRNKVPPTIYFTTKLSDDSKPPARLPKTLQQFFRWKISPITPNTIRNCILFMKFEIVRPSNTTDNSYLGSWCKHMPTADFSQLEDWRKVNHYPGSFHMGRKDKLWLRLRNASQKYDGFETFHPMTFVLPKDYDELRKYWESSPSNLFIMKPPASARGNGVKVINQISQIPESALKLPESTNATTAKKSTIIVQQYISNPCLLENGLKFDLRIYVLITSVDPLRIYVYEEGLVRFASSKYSNQDDGIIDQYMHLTNYFVNKNNQEYRINNDCESLQGCKWTLKRFWRYLRDHHKQVDTEVLWGKIIDIIVKTIICCETPMTRLSHQNCKNDYMSYELFGFDILLDDNFKPWILEVNITPSLKSESNLDMNVKSRVIKDMFNIAGYHLPPPTAEVNEKLNHPEDLNLFFNPRLYTENLTRCDKIKHLKYQKIFKTQSEIRKQTIRQEQFVNNQIQSLDPGQMSADSSPQERDQSGISGAGANRQSVHYSDEDSQSSNSKTVSSDSILSDLTQSDVRVLMLTEDELSRCGQFKRVFPSATSSHYLDYFDKPRYYNLLLDAWEQKYCNNRKEGIQRLSRLANFLG